MPEIVTTYKLDDLDQPIPMDRDEFYNSQIKVFKKIGKPTRAVEVVQLLLFTPDRQLILQKRSKMKAHNPKMLDKSLGGHIKFGDSPYYTLMLETLQELNVPAFVVSTEDDFKKTYKLLNNYINSSALVQFIDCRTYNSKKVINGDQVEIGDKYHFYLGVYNGALKPSDKEASGLIFVEYRDLLEEIKEASNLYTEDLKFFLYKYQAKIEKFLSNLG